MLPLGWIGDETLQETLLRAGLEPGVGAALRHGVADARHQLAPSAGTSMTG